MASKARRFHCGNIVDAEALRRGGWFIGHFIEDDETRRTDSFEVKSWRFDVGATSHTPKRLKDVWEFTLILEGRGRGVIDGEEIELGERQYFVVPPGICNNFPDYVYQPMRGITVKAPSIEGSKEPC